MFFSLFLSKRDMIVYVGFVPYITVHTLSAFLSFIDGAFSAFSFTEDWPHCKLIPLYCTSKIKVLWMLHKLPSLPAPSASLSVSADTGWQRLSVTLSEDRVVRLLRVTVIAVSTIATDKTANTPIAIMVYSRDFDVILKPSCYVNVSYVENICK